MGYLCDGFRKASPECPQPGGVPGFGNVPGSLDAPDARPGRKDRGIFQPHSHPLDHLLFLAAFGLVFGAPGSPAGVILGLDDEPSTGARRALVVDLEQRQKRRLQRLERRLIHARHERFHGHRHVPQQLAKTAFRDGREHLADAQPFAGSHSARRADVKVGAQPAALGLLCGCHGGIGRRPVGAGPGRRKTGVFRCGPDARQNTGTLFRRARARPRSARFPGLAMGPGGRPACR